ncbi:MULTISPECIES: TetR/AcrR family transcriptional regulator [unclassified Nocardiopsis]|uniref:TetR/AcrR family transcriptional regulator n=1 Tax=unclassified Nocardiopsis TaxID=2649073 RepID=UPI001916C6F3|nr:MULTISPECIES: TetR/AcrR family transcriptional regulator [unclassified Nocardiopsis]
MVIASTRVVSRTAPVLEPQEYTVAPSTDTSAAERELRADRILDAAEELMLTWGHRKVTIEDVARRARVGKGTVYLHFATKDALLMTVVMRAQLDMVRDLLETMRRSPDNIRPSEMARNLYLRQLESPVLRYVFTGSAESFTDLSHSASAVVGDLIQERIRALRTVWTLLREHGVLRTDRPFDDQIYAFSAAFLGHMFAAPLLEDVDFHVPDHATRADLIAQSIRLLMEEEVLPGGARTAQPRVVEVFSRLEGRLSDEIERRKQATRST